MWEKFFISCCKNIFFLSDIYKDSLSSFLLLTKNTSIVFPVWPIGLLVFLAFIASNYSTSRALEEHTALHLICYGLVFSKLTNRLIVS